MQKIIEVRASQGSLSEKMKPYLSQGWRIVSTTKGSEWTRVFNTYKWTIVLEKNETNIVTARVATAEINIKCPKCGNIFKIDKNAQTFFCPKCGTKLMK